jgi:hypothetical protein
MRKLALKSIDKIITKDDNERENLKLIKADLLRRSLQFDEMIEEFKDVTFEDEIRNEIIKFQLELAAKEDSACYTIEDVPKKVTITLDVMKITAIIVKVDTITIISTKSKFH